MKLLVAYLRKPSKPARQSRRRSKPPKPSPVPIPKGPAPRVPNYRPAPAPPVRKPPAPTKANKRTPRTKQERTYNDLHAHEQALWRSGWNTTHVFQPYPDEAFTPYALANGSISTEEKRALYSKWRGILRKRGKRIEKSEFADSKIAREIESLPTLKSMTNEHDLNAALADAFDYMFKANSSVSDLKLQRAKSLDTLHSNGFTFVDETNFKQFTDFMEYARGASLDKIYDSERIATLFTAYADGLIKPDELRKIFRSWQKHEVKQGKIRSKRGQYGSGIYRENI